MKTVACFLRNVGLGWYVIDNEGHWPLGVAGVDTLGDRLRLRFDFRARRVHTFVVTLDETYILQDLIAGASVAYDNAEIYIKRVGVPGYIAPASLAAFYGNLNVYGLLS